VLRTSSAWNRREEDRIRCFLFSTDVWAQIASEIEMGVELYQTLLKSQIYGGAALGWS
jgi:hypothetical protein